MLIPLFKKLDVTNVHSQFKNYQVFKFAAWTSAYLIQMKFKILPFMPMSFSLNGTSSSLYNGMEG